MASSAAPHTQKRGGVPLATPASVPRSRLLLVRRCKRWCCCHNWQCSKTSCPGTASAKLRTKRRRRKPPRTYASSASASRCCTRQVGGGRGHALKAMPGPRQKAESILCAERGWAWLCQRELPVCALSACAHRYEERLLRQYQLFLRRLNSVSAVARWATEAEERRRRESESQVVCSCGVRLAAHP